jgi:hypothetical protein
MEGFSFNKGPQKGEREKGQEGTPPPDISDIDGFIANMDGEDALNLTDPGTPDRGSLMEDSVKSTDMHIIKGAEAEKGRIPGKEFDANEDLADGAKRETLQ